MATIDITALLAADPNVDAALREFLAPPLQAQIGVRGSDRWHEVRDEETADQRRDERREQIARGD